MMRQILVGVALTLSLAAPAAAADLRMPVKAAPAPVVAPVYSWTGCYIGVQGGYSWANTAYNTDIPPTPGTGTSFDLRGGVAGGHLGCNYQFNTFVLGVEGDGEWTGLKGDDAGFAGTIDEIKGRWQASVRGRAGFTTGPALFYATGGIAWMNVRYARPDFDPTTLSETLTGWTVGGGMEWAFARNWSARVEYRYTRFDEEGFPFTTGSARTLLETKVNTIRGGISYRWGG